MSNIEEAVIAKIKQRAAIGEQKYGTTMERTDLSEAQWLKHAQEEAMDLCVYLEKLTQAAISNEQILVVYKDILSEAIQLMEESKDPRFNDFLDVYAGR